MATIWTNGAAGTHVHNLHSRLPRWFFAKFFGKFFSTPFGAGFSITAVANDLSRWQLKTLIIIKVVTFRRLPSRRGLPPSNPGVPAVNRCPYPTCQLPLSARVSLTKTRPWFTLLLGWRTRIVSKNFKFTHTPLHTTACILKATHPVCVCSTSGLLCVFFFGAVSPYGLFSHKF